MRMLSKKQIEQKEETIEYFRNEYGYHYENAVNDEKLKKGADGFYLPYTWPIEKSYKRNESLVISRYLESIDRYKREIEKLDDILKQETSPMQQHIIREKIKDLSIEIESSKLRTFRKLKEIATEQFSWIMYSYMYSGFGQFDEKSFYADFKLITHFLRHLMMDMNNDFMPNLFSEEH